MKTIDAMNERAKTSDWRNRGQETRATKKTHDWINFPNKGKRKCLTCGCIAIHTTKNKKVYITYERDGIVSEQFIECKR